MPAAGSNRITVTTQGEAEAEAGCPTTAGSHGRRRGCGHGRPAAGVRCCPLTPGPPFTVGSGRTAAQQLTQPDGSGWAVLMISSGHQRRPHQGYVPQESCERGVAGCRKRRKQLALQRAGQRRRQ